MLRHELTTCPAERINSTLPLLRSSAEPEVAVRTKPPQTKLARAEELVADFHRRMGEKLNDPPLIEALCEFRFDPAAPWDWTVSGRLYEQIKAEFPKRAQRSGVGLRLGVVEGPPQVPTVVHAPERVQLRSADDSAMVQVAPHLLAINHLRPYSKWESFRALILQMHDKHAAICDRPAIVRIGLRYINEIELGAAPVELSDVIAFTLPWRGAERELIGFYQRHELAYQQPAGVLVHQTGIRRRNGKRVVMLDLDFGSQPDEAFGSRATVVEWLDRAHDRIYELFRDSLNADYYEKRKEGR